MPRHPERAERRSAREGSRREFRTLRGRRFFASFRMTKRGARAKGSLWGRRFFAAGGFCSAQNDKEGARGDENEEGKNTIS